MKVLHVTSWYPMPGRPTANIFVQRHVIASAVAAEVAVLHIPDPNTVHDPPYGFIDEIDPGLTAGVPTFRMRVRAAGGGQLSYLQYLRAARRALDEIAAHEGPFDIVHAHTLDSAVPAIRWARRRGLPVVQTEHFSGVGLGRLTRGQQLKARYAYGRSDVVMPVSQFLAGQVRTIAEPRRIEVVPNVLDVEIFKFDPDVAVDRRTLTFVGRMHPVKRPGLALEVFAAARAAGLADRLVMIGDGPLVDDVKADIARRNIGEHVAMLGTVEPEELAKYLQRAAVVLSTSEVETFGQSLVEAQACGAPVVAPDVGGLREVLSSADGLLVGADAEPAAYVAALGAVLDGGGVRSRVARAAHMAESFGLQPVGAALNTLYGSVAD